MMLEPNNPPDRTGESSSSAEPPTPSEKPVVVGTPEWDELNERRAKLIYKKNRQGLTDAERVEYERLQDIASAALAVAFPRPDWSKEMAIIENRLSELGDTPKQ